MGINETLKAISDPVRRDILQMLKSGRKTAGEIAEHFELTGATVSYHLTKLKSADLIAEEKYKKEVLSHFFKYGRLTQIPTQRKKREIVLLEIAKQFERGREYDEKEVNEIIHRFHEDHCTIRREMIACGIMARQKETYWLV